MKKIWIIYRGKYNEECQEFCFSHSCTKDEIIGTLQRTFKIDGILNIRLRNFNSCIVPINILTLESNTRNNPYKIETWTSEWQLCMSCSQGLNKCDRSEWGEAWKSKLSLVESRVTAMENLIEILSNKNSTISSAETEESVQNRIINLHSDLNELIARLDANNNTSEINSNLPAKFRSPLL